MKNSLVDLNNYLFEAIERINDDDIDEETLKKEIKKGDALAKIGAVILDNAKTQLSAMKFASEYGDEKSEKYTALMIGSKS